MSCPISLVPGPSKLIWLAQNAMGQGWDYCPISRDRLCYYNIYKQPTVDAYMTGP